MANTNYFGRGRNEKPHGRHGSNEEAQQCNDVGRFQNDFARMFFGQSHLKMPCPCNNMS
jgi:hypothetical protein